MQLSLEDIAKSDKITVLLSEDIMHEFINQYGLFLLETITITTAILIIIGGFFALSKKEKQSIEIKDLSAELLDEEKKSYKIIFHKKLKIKKDKTIKPKLFIIDFDGDIKASQVEALRQEISTILSIATKDDAIMIKLESPGGVVNGYGLAASQLQRIRDKNIPLTVCIDKVAASGGYLMAAVANEIIAAPFAIVGSIGVVTQFPNFHRLLKNNDIDIELLTAGKFKRTLTMLGENTDEGRAKFKEDLEKIHHAFSHSVLSHRKDIKLDEVTTGEHWLAQDAIELKLVDKIQTSDDWIFARKNTHQIFIVKANSPQTFIQKLIKPATKLFSYSYL